MAVAETELLTAVKGRAGSRCRETFVEIERAMKAVLESYANVHRGAGFKSMVSTALYEGARSVVLDVLGLDPSRHDVVFGTPWAAALLADRLGPAVVSVLSSRELGLPLGVRAVVARRDALFRNEIVLAGGGTVKIVSPGSVVPADGPHRFEAGTPAVVNVVGFAKALQIATASAPGPGAFRERETPASAAEDILFRDEFAGMSGRNLLARLRSEIVGKGCQVPTSEGFRPFVNLDHAASTPTLYPVWEAARRTLSLPGTALPEIVRCVRGICAGFLHAPLEAYDVHFTGNATEAINLAARGFRGRQSDSTVPVILITGAEHNSNDLPWRDVPGAEIVRLPVDAEGFPDLGEMERLLRDFNHDGAHGAKRIRLVAVTGASNVLGSCPDLRAMSRLAHAFGASILVDAAQLIAHRAIDMEGAGIDALAFSGHKMYAPFGSGALVARKGFLELRPDELARVTASGEENAAGIAALGKAMVLLGRVGMEVVEEEERALTAAATEVLAGIPAVEIFGVKDPRSARFRQKAGILSFALEHVPHNLLAQELAESGGIGVRDGCFCAHLLVKRLLDVSRPRARAAEWAMKIVPGFTAAVLPGLVRISFGLENDGSDIDRFARTLREISRRPRGLLTRLVAALKNGTPVLPRTPERKAMTQACRSAFERIYGSRGTAVLRHPGEPVAAFPKATAPAVPTPAGRPKFRCCRRSFEFH